MNHNTTESKKELSENIDKTNITTENENTEIENEHTVGYPDISKANTKMIVIGSLICIIAIFLLSIFFPSDKSTETDNPSTETAITTEASSN